MREVYREIEINATPEVVWQILTDFEHYPDWNPLIQRCAGQAEAGTELELEVRLPDGRIEKLRSMIVTADATKELSWTNRYSLGVMHEDHLIAIRPVSQGKVQVIQVCTFTGPLVAVKGEWIEGYQQGIEAMNAALQFQAERQVSRVAA